MKNKLHIDFNREELLEVCRKHSITKLAFFGSVVRDDFAPDSDVDIMVEFAPDKTLGFGIVDVIDDFSKVFGGRQVDLMTFNQFKRSLPRLNHYINQDLKVYYEHEAA